MHSTKIYGVNCVFFRLLKVRALKVRALKVRTLKVGALKCWILFVSHEGGRNFRCLSSIYISCVVLFFENSYSAGWSINFHFHENHNFIIAFMKGHCWNPSQATWFFLFRIYVKINFNMPFSNRSVALSWFPPYVLDNILWKSIK